MITKFKTFVLCIGLLAAAEVLALDVISLNFNSEKGNANNDNGDGLVQARSWYNFSGASGSSDDIKTQNGASVGTVSWSCNNLWAINSNLNGEQGKFFNGYLDDGTTDNRIRISVAGIPFDRYEVIIYQAADSGDLKFLPPQVNGTFYTYANEKMCVAPTQDFDAEENAYGTTNQKDEFVLGENVLRIAGAGEAGLTGDLTIVASSYNQGYNSAGRGNIAAIQIVEKEVKIFGAEIVDNVKWSTKEGLRNSTCEYHDGMAIVLTNKAENPVVLFDSPLSSSLLSIVSDSGRVSLSTTGVADVDIDIVAYDIGSACDGVVFGYDPGDANIIKGDKMVYLNFDYEGEIKAGYGYLGSENNISLCNMSRGKCIIGGSGFVKNDVDVFGGSEIVITGQYKTQEETLSGIGATHGTVTVSEGAELEVSHIKVVNSGDGNNEAYLNIDGSVKVLSECGSNVYSERASKGVLFGHYSGHCCVNVGATGILDASDSWIQMTFSAQTDMLVDGGSVRARGVNGGGRQSTLTLENDACLELSEGFLNCGSLTQTYKACRIANIGESGWSNPGPVVFDAPEGSATAIDPNGSVITFEGALSGAGDITISDSDASEEKEGVVRFLGDVSGYSGRIVVEEGAYVGFMVTINHAGRFEVPFEIDPEFVKLYDASGEEVEVKARDNGVLSFDIKYDGTSVCWWDYEFEGNLENSGSDKTALTWDSGSPIAVESAYSGNDSDRGIKVPCRPYRDVRVWPHVATFVFYGTMPSENNKVAICFGSATKGSLNTVFLATGNVNQDEVRLCRGSGRGESTVLCSMKVPNAQTQNHLYAFVLKQVDEKTVCNIYLDGELLQPWAFDGVVTLGDGFQLGSIHGGVDGSFGYGAPTDSSVNAVVQFLRVYDLELTASVMAEMAKAYPYVSPNGSYQRDVSSEQNWVENGAWSNESDGSRVSSPREKSAVKIATRSETASLAVNVGDDISFEAVQISGEGKLSLKSSAESSGIIRSIGRVSVQADVVFDHNVFRMDGAPLVVSDGKCVTFDFSKYDFSSCYCDIAIPVTGAATLGSGAEVSAILPNTEGYSCEFRFNSAFGGYELFIDAPSREFVATVGENGAVEWKWGDAAIQEPDWSMMNNVAVVKRGSGSLSVMQASASDYVVKEGTLAFTSKSSVQGTVQIDEGGTFNLNGLNGGNGFNIILNGGRLANYGNGILYYNSQIDSVVVWKNSEIDSSSNFGFISGQNARNSLCIDLNGCTLRKVGSYTFHLGNVEMTNGRLEIVDGWVEFCEVGSTLPEVSFAGGKLRCNRTNFQGDSALTNTIEKMVGPNVYTTDGGAEDAIVNEAVVILGGSDGDIALPGAFLVRNEAVFKDGIVEPKGSLGMIGGEGFTLDNAILKVMNGVNVEGLESSARFATVNGGGLHIGANVCFSVNKEPTIGDGTLMRFDLDMTDRNNPAYGVYQSNGQAKVDTGKMVVDINVTAGKIGAGLALPLFKIASAASGFGAFSGSVTFADVIPGGKAAWKFQTSETDGLKVGVAAFNPGFKIVVR